MAQTRRGFLTATGAAAAWAAVPAATRAMAGAAATEGSLVMVPERTLAQVPANFTGLSYESAQLIYPGFLSASNHQLVALLRTLGRRGVLRIGGNTSAFTVFVKDGSDSGAAQAFGPDRSTHPATQVPGAYRITPQAIREVNSLLEATGWHLLYGLNLKNGTPESAADEAAYVAKVCGQRLLALQFGNEADLFTNALVNNQGARWTYEEFFTRWQAMYKVVHARVPQAAIAGPDTAASGGWPGRFAADAKGMFTLLTSHYYAEGPPTDPKMTIDYLLHPGQRLQTEVLTPLKAAKTEGLAYRMSEGNSCYQGGKPGVSDTFASALWAADFMLTLAARGAAGVNFHGGANGVYAPIAGLAPGGLTVRPDFYGMLLGGEFAGTSMIDTQVNAGGANVTAYAAKQARGVQGAVINKSDTDVSLRVTGAPKHGAVRAWPLTAPAIDSKSGVSFDGATVAENGTWVMPGGRPLPAGPLHVPAYSAVLVRWGA